MFIVTNNMRVHRKLILCIFNERFASFLIISCIHTPLTYKLHMIKQPHETCGI